MYVCVMSVKSVFSRRCFCWFSQISSSQPHSISLFSLLNRDYESIIRITLNKKNTKYIIAIAEAMKKAPRIFRYQCFYLTNWCMLEFVRISAACSVLLKKKGNRNRHVPCLSCVYLHAHVLRYSGKQREKKNVAECKRQNIIYAYALSLFLMEVDSMQL